MSTQNDCDILLRLFEFAPIAQQVERIHGKDEVASSNLAGGSTVKKVCLVQTFYFAIIMSTPVAARVAAQVPMATVSSDFSMKLKIRATARPAQAVGSEPVA